MADIGIPGGPFRSAVWGGLHLHPKEDASPEIKLGGREYESKLCGDGDDYAEASSVIGYIKSDFVMNASDFKVLAGMQDGKKRSGTFSDANGDVYVVNARISGECMLSNGVVSLTLSGNVRKQ